MLCVLAGSALDLTWAQDHVPAIVYAWYPGGEGGSALADVLFGDVSPAGRLPITFPRSMDDVPYFGSYAMKGRTYRYAEKTPLYPFGYGLSYTKFAYSEVAVSSARVRAGDTVTVSATVKNVGKVTSDEVVQLYVKDLEASCAVPAARPARLRARASRPRARRQTISFDLTARDLALVNDAGKRVLEPGRFRATIGGSQPDARSAELTGTVAGRDRVRRRRLISSPLAPRSGERGQGEGSSLGGRRQPRALQPGQNTTLFGPTPPIPLQSVHLTASGGRRRKQFSQPRVAPCPRDERLRAPNFRQRLERHAESDATVHSEPSGRSARLGAGPTAPVSRAPSRPGRDRFVLVTDGVWTAATDADIAKACAGASASEIVAAIDAAAREPPTT